MKEATFRLRTEIVPALANELLESDYDITAILQRMHEKGVNYRLLGYMRLSVDRETDRQIRFDNYVLTEMVPLFFSALFLC